MSPDAIIVSPKSRLRRSVLTRRAGLDPAQRAAAGRRLTDTVLAQPEVAAGARVAAYASLASEPPTDELLEALLRRGVEVLLPVLMADRDLDWARYEGPASLAAGARVPEPVTARLGRAALAGADVVLVPALAVDRRGHRLGRGGGSYDRVLPRVRPGTLVAAVLYDDELVDHLPSEPHDVPVHCVLTPNRLLRLPLAPADPP